MSGAQTEFNKLMKRLEKARSRLEQERCRLDCLVKTCGTTLMPLVNQLHRLDFQMVLAGVDQLKRLKFTEHRRVALEDLIGDKAHELVEDSCGLSESEVEQMRGVVDAMDRTSPEEKRQAQSADLDYIRSMMEVMAGQAGVNLDLSDLDMTENPADLERKLFERLQAARQENRDARPQDQEPARKPTKAQLQREKRKQEAEEMKKRDLKSLYKQLAKVLHPDLETDPDRKLQKDAWMKRLTTAYASSDLRELLSIEMEWLGAEASNLTAATDEKLKVYCAVLKEQIAETKAQQAALNFAPEYSLLDRFRGPFGGTFIMTSLIQEDLTDAIIQNEDMLEVLHAGGKECQRMMNRWADDEIREVARERRTLFGRF